MATVRIWQANIGKDHRRHVPMANGEGGNRRLRLDGVTLPAAEDRAGIPRSRRRRDDDGAMFPTGNLVDDLEVPGVGTLRHADQFRRTGGLRPTRPRLGLRAERELQPAISEDPGHLLAGWKQSARRRAAWV